jgi:hypothetical protein
VIYIFAIKFADACSRAMQRPFASLNTTVPGSSWLLCLWHLTNASDDHCNRVDGSTASAGIRG